MGGGCTCRRKWRQQWGSHALKMSWSIIKLAWLKEKPFLVKQFLQSFPNCAHIWFTEAAGPLIKIWHSRRRGQEKNNLLIMTTNILQWKRDNKNASAIKAYLLEYLWIGSYFQKKNPSADISQTYNYFSVFLTLMSASFGGEFSISSVITP